MAKRSIQTVLSWVRREMSAGHLKKRRTLEEPAPTGAPPAPADTPAKEAPAPRAAGQSAAEQSVYMDKAEAGKASVPKAGGENPALN